MLVPISALAATAVAATLRVPGDQPTIQAGLDASAEGDTVLVAPGTYTGEGNRDLDFGGVDRVLLSEAGPEATVIDCQDDGRGFDFHSGETVASRVTGFTVTGGNAPGIEGGAAFQCMDSSSPTLTKCVVTGNVDASGIYCSRSSPILIDCAIEGNSGRFWGGGLFCDYYSAPIVENCTIIGNAAGGLASFHSSPIITNCTITDNYDAPKGAGVYCLRGAPTLIDCTIANNSADSWGGGVVCVDGPSTLINCTIVDNSAGLDGGGLLCDFGASPHLINCNVSGNSAVWGGGGLVSYDTCSIALTNCTIVNNTGGDGGGLRGCCGSSVHATNTIIWGNSPNQIDYQGGSVSITYSNIQSGWPGEGNIHADPLFLDPIGADYHLRPGSPCIDAGTSSGATGTDFEGDLRPWGAGWDIGADEYTGVGIERFEPPIFAPRTMLAPAYPNPFNPSTTIPFALAEAGGVRLAIYDLKGALVRILVDGPRSAGLHAVRWDGRNRVGLVVPTGVYVVRFEGGGAREARRLVLVK
ncbi:MAG: hypothetical protein CME06_03735 [Gemmatimonadetes bacterium]|nr:hypothetical protein [Gemmatimonadota bacterium]